MKNKIKKCCFLIIFFGLLVGCDRSSGKYNVSCKIWSVNQSNYGTYYICSNKQGSYIYQDLNDVCGIYNYESQEMIVPLYEKGLFHCMAASDYYLLYHTEENYGTLRVYSFNECEQVLELDHMNVCGMKADEENVFVVIQNDKTDTYDVGVFSGDDFVWLNEVLEHEIPERQEGEYTYFGYAGYELIVRENDQKYEIAFIEKEDFQFSCSPQNIYVKSKDRLFCIQHQPDFLPTFSGEYGGIATSMLQETDGECYFIAQYSKKAYQENPSIDFAQTSMLCKYDLYDGTFEVLYKSDMNEQIVGFSNEKSDVYVMTDDGLYRINIESKEKTLVLENRFESGKERGTYYFEDYLQGMVVFSKNSSQHENGPRYEGYVTY